MARRHGRKIRIRETAGTDEFMATYRAALDGPASPADHPSSQAAAPSSLRWLVERYYGSAEFGRLGDRTRRVSRRVLVSRLWGIPDPEAEREMGQAISEQSSAEAETKRMTKEECAQLMEWLAKNNPAVKEAQGRRRAAIEAALLRTMMGLGEPPRD